MSRNLCFFILARFIIVVPVACDQELAGNDVDIMARGCSPSWAEFQPVAEQLALLLLVESEKHSKYP